MNQQPININFVLMIFTMIIVVIGCFGLVRADTMSSSIYKIQSDSLNFGGVRSASGSYTIEDTMGEVGTGISSSTNYVMGAGYQQMQSVSISVTPADNVIMSPAIGGVTGGTANGSTTFTVITDDPAGYITTVVADLSPALQSATSSFADYVPASSIPDYTFVNIDTASSFAFAPEGADIDNRYKYLAATCNTVGGTYSPGSCWDGLSTSPKTIVNRTSSNHPTGTISKINFRAESGSNHIQMNGIYTATTTITVIPL